MTRHVLRLSEPAEGFTDSFLLGNGSLGASLRGEVGTERIDLNLDSLWSGGPQARSAADAGTGPGAELLPELRAAIRAGDHARADALSGQMQGSGWTESYQPVGYLSWRYADHSTGERYRRELNVAEAVAVTGHGASDAEVEVTSFVSAPDNVLVMTVSGPAAAADVLLPEFVSPHPIATDRREGRIVATGRVPAHVLPNYVEQSPAIVYGEDEPDEHGTVAAGAGFAVAVAVERTGPDELRLIASVSGGFRGYDQRPSADVSALAALAEQAVAKALTYPTDELRARHRADYRGFFDRVDLDLSASPATEHGDPSRAELFFHFGRYLLISSSRPGTQAANLQGIWNIDVRPGWSANYTTNINAQMNYWAAEQTALHDLHAPLLDLADDLAASGATSAAFYYGAAGSVVHHNTDIWRFSAPVNGDAQWANWPAGLYWLAAHRWDHHDYGSDEEPSDRRALAVHRAAALFALDMLVEDADGTLVTSPSTSPEHRFLIPPSMTAAVSEGTCMDQELVREVLTHYLALAEHVAEQEHDDLPARARKAVDRLRLPRIGANGELCEWADERQGSEPGHRHLSHLYGLHPGTRITEAGTPAEFAAARRSLTTRLTAGSGYTGWSQAWVLCLAARLRDRDLAQRSIDVLCDDLSSRSLLDLHPHPDWPEGMIFQIDGNLGAVSGLTELLVQSHEGAISLLKTLPHAWREGRITGIRCRGGQTVDVAWSAGALVEATVRTGDSTRTVAVELPEPAGPQGQGSITVLDAEDRAVPATTAPSAVAGRQRVAWTGAADASYRLIPRAPAAG